MRIAYCTESLPPLVDGVTRTLTELVTTLRETAHEFMFLSSVKPDAGLAWRDRVHTVPSLPLLVYPYYRLGLPVARTLDPVLDRFAPDVMHVVTPSLLGWYGVKYAQRRASRWSRVSTRTSCRCSGTTVCAASSGWGGTWCGAFTLSAPSPWPRRSHRWPSCTRTASPTWRCGSAG